MNPSNSGLLPDAQPGADLGFIPDPQPWIDLGFIPDPPSLPFGAASPPWTDVGFVPDAPNDLGFIPDPPSPPNRVPSITLPEQPPYVLGQSADAPKPGATAYPIFPAGTIEGVLERLGFTKFAAGAVQGTSGSLTGTGTSLARLSDPGALPNTYAQHVRDIQLAGSHPEWFQEPVDPITLQPRSDEAGPEERARGIHELTWDLLRSRMTAPGTALAQGAQQAANQYKALRDIAVGPELAGKAGEMAGGTLPFVAEALIPWIGPELAAAHGGLNSGGETWQQAYDFYKSQGAGEEDAERKADDAATAVGSATALIFSGLPGGQEAEQAVAKTVGQRIASVFKAGSQAGAVMTADTAQRLAQAKRTYRPDLTLGEAAKELMESYLSGQILGSLMHAPRELAGKGPKEAAGDNTADIEAATPTSPRPPDNVAPTAGESGEIENAGAPEVPLHQQIFDSAAAMRDLQETLRAYQIPSSEPSGPHQQAEAAGQLIPQALRQAEEADADLHEPGAGALASVNSEDPASTGLLSRAMEELLRGPREQEDAGAMDAAARRPEERAQAEVDAAATRAALDSQAEAASGEVTRLESAARQAGAAVRGAGALKDDLAAPKTSPIWAAFDSGWTRELEDVDREEAKRLGLPLEHLTDEAGVSAGERSSNANPQASVENVDPRLQGFLQGYFGNQINIDKAVSPWGSQRPGGRPPGPCRPPAGPGRRPSTTKVPQELEEAWQRAKNAGWSSEAAQVIKKLPAVMGAILSTAQFMVGGKNPGWYLRLARLVNIDSNPKSWHGHPIMVRHEIGHHTHYELGLVTDTQVHPDIAKAMEDDLKALQTRMRKAKGPNGKLLSERELRSKSLWMKEAESLYGFKCKTAPLGDQIKMARFCDTICGLSRGELGSGHDKKHMKATNNGAKEAFANTFSALLDGDEVFRNSFPNLASMVKLLVKL